MSPDEEISGEVVEGCGGLILVVLVLAGALVALITLIVHRMK